MHKLLSTGVERSWELDINAAAATQPWSRRAPALLAQEVREMAEHFPHWLLLLGRADRPRRCACGDLISFSAGAARCITCEQRVALVDGDELLWLGHLPALLRPLPALLRRLPALAAAGHPTIQAGDATYLLAPLLVNYPTNWQQSEPLVRYAPGFLPLLGIPEQVSGTHHLLNDRRACLYAGGQWRGVSVRVVLQQRVVNHVASLLKIAGGIQPHEAFIGRIH